MNLQINKNDNIHKKRSSKYQIIRRIIKYRLAANITEYHIISKLIYNESLLKTFWSSESFEVKYNIGFGIPNEFQSRRRRKNSQIDP